MMLTRFRSEAQAPRTSSKPTMLQAGQTCTKAEPHVKNIEAATPFPFGRLATSYLQSGFGSASVTCLLAYLVTCLIKKRFQ
eukprot:3856272-Rhodomonas_salina.1